MTSVTLPRKDLFDLPDGMIYLDGNSLGPLPKSVNAALSSMVTDQWGAHLIKGWNVDDWMGQPMRVGNMVGKLIGAAKNSVTMGDTLSVKVYQALSAAVQMRPERKVILSDSGNFPSDLYMAQGLIAQLDQGHELRIVDPLDVMDAITDDVAVVMITQVDYRSGRMHDMTAMTAKAHEAGAVMIWDLAHSAGAVPVDLAGCNCEFAVGCTYKYLNGGPGAPAFIYVRPEAKKHGRQNQIEGHLERGQKVVVIEDLISTGKSSLNAVDALKDSGAEIKGMLALFSYGFDFAVENFNNQQLELTTLSDYGHLLEQAKQSGHFKEEEIELLKSWRKDPSTWTV
jgi:kynureninase